MAAPLELLQREVWLNGPGSCRYPQELESRLSLLHSHPEPQRILLIEPDPVTFVASFVAACVTATPIILGNPKWAIAEWQQAIALTQPTLIWGDCPIEHPLDHSHLPPVALEPGWILIATGGSSGQLRFAVHTWETLTASVAAFQRFFQVETIHALSVLPLHHVGGLMQVVRSLTTQGRLTLYPWKALLTDPLPDIEPRHLFLSLVPTQLQQLLSLPHRAEWLAQFRTVLLGGAPAWEALLHQARTHTIRIAQTYGMTETASQVAAQLPADFLNNRTGYQVLPHADLTRSNGSDDAAVLMIRAQSLALGYIHTPQAPQFKPLHPIFQSDDIGVFDSSGRLHLTGRRSQMIISGGENVFPAEVEAAILATGLVSDVCVVGIPDPRWGQAIAAAYVPLRPAITADQLIFALAHRLSRYKMPKHWQAYPHLLRNAQGKLNYGDLTHQLATQTQPAPPTSLNPS